MPSPRPRFGHGVHLLLKGPSELQVFGSYHVSQRNVSTGKLTPAMLREVLTEALGPQMERSVRALALDDRAPARR